MAITDIFKRKKKDEFLDLGAAAPGAPSGYGPAAFPQPTFPPAPTQPVDLGLPGLPPTAGFQPIPAVSADQVENLRRSVESLNYKLDTLKAAVDSINARLANIEAALKASPVERQEGWSAF